LKVKLAVGGSVAVALNAMYLPCADEYYDTSDLVTFSETCSIYPPISIAKFVGGKNVPEWVAFPV
jgi:hypothetical protein